MKSSVNCIYDNQWQDCEWLLFIINSTSAAYSCTSSDSILSCQYWGVVSIHSLSPNTVYNTLHCGLLYETMQNNQLIVKYLITKINFDFTMSLWMVDYYIGTIVHSSSRIENHLIKSVVL